MKDLYVVDGWIFSKTKEDEYGNCYYDIIHPSGRTWDYQHLFKSYDEMISYVKSKTYTS